MPFEAGTYVKTRAGTVEFVPGPLVFMTQAETEIYGAVLGAIVRATPGSVKINYTDKPVNACVWPRLKEHVEASDGE